MHPLCDLFKRKHLCAIFYNMGPGFATKNTASATLFPPHRSEASENIPYIPRKLKTPFSGSDFFNANYNIFNNTLKIIYISS